MSIEGNIIKVKGDYVYIKQFYTGYIYKAKKEHVNVRGTVDNPAIINGRWVGKVNDLENFTLVKAPWIHSK